MGMNWTADYGTPEGDAHKYQLMSNGEFDFWQTSVLDHFNQLVPPDTNLYGNSRGQTWSRLGLPTVGSGGVPFR